MVEKNYNKFYGKRRFCAFSLLFLFMSTFLFNIPVFAAPPSGYVENANKIHYDNPNYKSVSDFDNRISEIFSITGFNSQNRKNQWLNPYIYDEYNNIIAYDLPFGEFSNMENGRMFKLETGKQGEYKYLGYDENGNKITNDHYFSGGEVVTKFINYDEDEVT